MKFSVILTMFFLVGCGHATTEMDRELALKLADKTPVIVQSAPPVVNVNVNGGQFQAPQQAPASELADTRTNCVESPVYDYHGNLLHYKKNCFGGR